MTAPQEGEKIGDVFVPCGEGKPVKVDKVRMTLTQASLLYN